jgi:hypothetical protein
MPIRRRSVHRYRLRWFCNTEVRGKDPGAILLAWQRTGLNLPRMRLFREFGVGVISGTPPRAAIRKYTKLDLAKEFSMNLKRSLLLPVVPGLGHETGRKTNPEILTKVWATGGSTQRINPAVFREDVSMQKSLLTAFAPLLALTVAACNLATPAAAQDSEAKSVQVNVSSTHRTYACHNPGDAIQVTGSSDILDITGSCGSLQVTGNSNSITIDSVQTVQFTGDSNSVLYRGVHRPTLSNTGRSNSIARATAGQAGASGGDTTVASNSGADTAVSAAVSSAMQAADAASEAAASAAGAVHVVQTRGNLLNIILSNQRTTQDCGDGKAVNINGYQNDISLTGSCSKVTLNGWGNTIRIEEVASIEVTGHTNTLTWERGRNVGKPSVQIDSGTGNSVRHLMPAN